MHLWGSSHDFTAGRAVHSPLRIRPPARDRIDGRDGCDDRQASTV
jgi:hypothetical protein